LARELQQNPTIASLRKPDGTLDMERYRQLAASQGLTPEGFEARVRRDLSLMPGGVRRQRVPRFLRKALSDLALNAFFERREVQVVAFQPCGLSPAKSIRQMPILMPYYQANSGPVPVH